ncbi:GNAT family N-acetyltransferase [Nocardia alba]|uniref:Acetyltransferase (GNAT) family protein n=1 Tax=Nocardia alba TaxID=225051 RepID=A0A4R1FJY4_9NOCA|nr:GNAT family N-acetyltransferase [Nocardia alba]TCJ95067.1 acetyltransferase (GNAT) family protein [Nocardia alba]
MATIVVRKATRHDVDAVAQTLALAFQHDPVMSWILPEPDRRAAGLPRFFATVARHLFLPADASDLALRPDDTVGGAALWTPPHQQNPSTLTELRTLPGIWQAFGRRTLAGKQVGDLLKKNHPTEPHWYLAMLGSAPDVRGEGYGHALLHSRLDRVDAEHAAAYLESSNPVNVPYYERFGFVVTGELRIPGGPTLWQMLRAAR